VTDIPYRIALIVGAGSGISASFARGLAAAGLSVGLAARNTEKLAPLAEEIGAETGLSKSSCGPGSRPSDR
jgi:NADP-dependent 3-hydroxy acid dehydrogenase YdfG